MNNIVIRNIEPQEITISGGGEVLGIEKVYVNGVDVTVGSAAYVIVPTKLSELENNVGYITTESDPTVPYYVKDITRSDITKWNNKQDALVSGVNIKTINSSSILGSGNLVVDTSYTAGTGIEITEQNVINNTITSYNDLEDLPTIPDKTSQLTNDSDYVSSGQLAEVAFNGSYLALSNTPANTSDFTNDGEDGVHPFITNQTDGLVNYFDKDFLFNMLPKVSDTDTSINLSPTVENAPLKMELGATALSQDGTPTPSSPEDIHTISGSNTIKVIGKNLYYTDSQTKTFTATFSGWKYLDGNGPADYSNPDNTLYKGYVISGKTYTFTCSINASASVSSALMYYDNTAIQTANGTELTYNKTFTAAKTGYIILRYYVNSGITVSVSNVMLEQNNQATTYQPYVSQEADIDLDTIEYCKIGTYSDRIFKNISSDPDYDSEKVDGAWYIKKNIGKVVLDGSETWYQDKELTNSWRYYSGHILQTAIATTGLSNHFLYTTTNAINGTDAEGITILNNDQPVIRLNKTYATTVETFKTWLGNNNTTLYYIMATPTYTQITGTLETQLENVYKNMLSQKGQTNISQINNDLAFNISATTLKDISSL